MHTDTPQSPENVMLILGLLIGCRSDQEVATTDAPDTVPDGTLLLQLPEDIAWLPDGPTTIGGLAENMDTLTLNGASITATDGVFSETITLSRGINRVVVSGRDVGGDTLTDQATVLAGAFASPGQTMPDVLSAHVGQAGLDTIGDLAAAALEPSLLLKTAGSLNPVYSSSPFPGTSLDADLVGLSFAAAEIDIAPADGALMLTVTLPQLVIDLDAYGEIVWIDYGMDLQMTADAAVITATIEIGAVDGGLDVTLVEPDIVLEGFAYDLSILPDFIEGYLFIETIQGTVEDMLVEQASATVPEMIDEALAGLAFSTTLALLEAEVTISAELADVEVTEAGIGLDMDVDVSVPGTGAASYAGYLAAPTGSPPEHDTDEALSLVLSDDLLNRTLFELWRGGALSMTLSTEDGSLDPTTIDGLPLDAATVQISPALPPVIVSGAHGLQLQAGAIDVVADTPGASFGEHIALRLTLLADASFSIADGLIQPEVGDISLDIEVLESDWGIPDASVSELVDWALPREELLAMVSEMGVALPTLGGLVISDATLSRDESGFYSVVSIEPGIE